MSLFNFSLHVKIPLSGTQLVDLLLRPFLTFSSCCSVGTSYLTDIVWWAGTIASKYPVWQRACLLPFFRSVTLWQDWKVGELGSVLCREDQEAMEGRQSLCCL